MKRKKMKRKKKQEQLATQRFLATLNGTSTSHLFPSRKNFQQPFNGN